MPKLDPIKRISRFDLTVDAITEVRYTLAELRQAPPGWAAHIYRRNSEEKLLRSLERLHTNLANLRTEVRIYGAPKEGADGPA